MNTGTTGNILETENEDSFYSLVTFQDPSRYRAKLKEYRIVWVRQTSPLSSDRPVPLTSSPVTKMDPLSVTTEPGPTLVILRTVHYP